MCLMARGQDVLSVVSGAHSD